LKKNRKCHGRKSNLHRCRRTGDWLLFCEDHSRQWVSWLSVLVFTIIAGTASIASQFPLIEYWRSETVEVPGKDNFQKTINKAKMEAVSQNTTKDNAVLGKVFVRPIAEFISTEKNDSHIAITLISPFKPLGTSYTYKADECRFLGKASYFDKENKEARFYIYAASCSRNDGSVYSADARKISGAKEIGYISLPGMSGKDLIPLVSEENIHTLPKDTNVEIFIDYTVAKFTNSYQPPN
jgi:hypothetical protein